MRKSRSLGATTLCTLAFTASACENRDKYIIGAEFEVDGSVERVESNSADVKITDVKRERAEAVGWFATGETYKIYIGVLNCNNNDIESRNSTVIDESGNNQGLDYINAGDEVSIEGTIKGSVVNDACDTNSVYEPRPVFGKMIIRKRVADSQQRASDRQQNFPLNLNTIMNDQK